MALRYFQAEITIGDRVFFRLVQAGSNDSAEVAVEEYCKDSLLGDYSIIIHPTIKATTDIKKPQWKEHYHIYCRELSSAQNEILEDKKWMKLQMDRWSYLDIPKTIEFMIESFWGTRDGWEYCKRKKNTTKINWRNTFSNNIERNKVYNNGKSKNDTSTSITSANKNSKFKKIE